MANEPTLDTILDEHLSALALLEGLTVVPGIPFKVKALPLVYVVYEGSRIDTGAQLYVARHSMLIGVLVPWMDAWELSERALYPWVLGIYQLLLNPDSFSTFFVDSNTIRVDSSRNGDGMISVHDKSYRAASFRYEVTATGE